MAWVKRQPSVNLPNAYKVRANRSCWRQVILFVQRPPSNCKFGVNETQGQGSDSASVIFDAMQSAKAKGIDVLIADTAGRLQNKTYLMNELEKVIRVMKKADESAPHECMIVLDAGTGQNAISQINLFGEVAPLSGVTITKLDGTAKGGVVFNVAQTTDVPIRFIGVGERIDDLQPFDSKEFVDALIGEEK